MSEPTASPREAPPPVNVQRRHPLGRLARRVLPFPKLFVALVLLWLTLNQSVSPGQILLGAVVALLASWTMAAFEPEPVGFRGAGAALRLAARVLLDIFRSNAAVGRIILTEGVGRNVTSGFMTVPLELKSRYGLGLLAIILTATPGTLWVNYDPARGELLLHVLDLVDEAYWVDLIKNRYERLLLEMFP